MYTRAEYLDKADGSKQLNFTIWDWLRYQTNGNSENNQAAKREYGQYLGYDYCDLPDWLVNLYNIDRQQARMEAKYNNRYKQDCYNPEPFETGQAIDDKRRAVKLYIYESGLTGIYATVCIMLYDKYTQAEIAQELNISQARVSQVKADIRQTLTGDGEEKSGGGVYIYSPYQSNKIIPNVSLKVKED